MRNKYPVILECSKNQKRRHKRKLKKYRVYYSYKENGIFYFTGRLNERLFNYLKDYCRKNHLKYRINNEYGERSSSYRKVFFENNKPFCGKYYFCSYCGRLCKKEKITVDHLYPIGTVRQDILLQKRLKRKGINNINDVKNLVPACELCNKRKGSKMGKWIIKGEIGRSMNLWIFRHILRIAFILLFILIIWNKRWDIVIMKLVENAIYNMY